MNFKVQQLGGKCSACGELVALRITSTFSNIDFWAGVCVCFLGFVLVKVVMGLIPLFF